MDGYTAKLFIYTKGDNFGNFLFASLGKKTSKKGSTLERKILLPQKPFHSFEKESKQVS